MHAISIKCRKIVWASLKLKSLATEDYKDREDWLFRPGFLEKAVKKLETEKALAKVTGLPSKQQKRPFQKDLGSFLTKDAPSKYGYRRTQCTKSSRTIHPVQTNGANANRASTDKTLRPRSQDNPSRGREDSLLFA